MCCFVFTKMSNFMFLNFENYNLNENITEAIKTYTPFCVCCLTKSGCFVNLTDCSHKQFLRDFSQTQLDLRSHLVCNLCHALLKKAEAFHRQVERSFGVLNSQLQGYDIHDIQPSKNIICLNTKKLHNVDIFEDGDNKYKANTGFLDVPEIVPNVSEPIVTIHEAEYEEVDNKNDIKIDTEPCKIEVPKPDKLKLKRKIKIEKSNAKIQFKKSTKKKRAAPFTQRFPDHIKVITLNEEEMLREREETRCKESFTKFAFQCADCILSFEEQDKLEDHLSRKHFHSEDAKYLCKICKTVQTSEYNVKRHTKYHYIRYECVLCQKRYSKIKSTVLHIGRVHGMEMPLFKCQNCDFTTESLGSLVYHKNKHRGDLTCTDCGKTLSSISNLNTHITEVHKKQDRAYDCRLCGKVYTSRSGLEHHLKTTHGTKQENKPSAQAYCGICNVQFSSKRNYKSHLKFSSRHINVDDKKFSCNECDKKFITNGLLKRHVDCVHLKIAKYECNLCSSRFQTRPDLQKHNLVVHENIPKPRNKICHHCGKGFTTAQVLRNHIRTHTGERPLSCSLCTATFGHNGALYTHRKLVHKIGKKE